MASDMLAQTLSWFAVGSVTLAATVVPVRADPIDPHRQMIAQIEKGLRPPLAAKGEPSPVWTLEERMEHYGVPAISIAVAFDGEVVWAKAYGEREKGNDLPVDENTLFQAASLSKPIAALAALSLVGKGKLELDAPVADYLQSWDMPENEFTQSQDVTLRHLLSHRAGTTIHGFKGYEVDADLPSSAQILKGVEPANTPPVAVDQIPGSSRRYSGGGYQVVQLLLEDLTGQPFAEVVEQEVFGPASLERSNYAHRQTDENIASGHVGGASDPIPAPGYFAYPELAAAGVWTTPTELLRIGSQVARARNGDSKLISEELARQLIPNSADEHGLGFGLNDAGDGVVFVHNGHNPGYSARWYSYADGRASVAILTNSDSGGKLIREVASAIGHAYGWKQDAFEARAIVALDESWKEQVAGDYAFGADSTEAIATVSLEDGKLWIDGALGERSRFYPTSKTDFFVPGGLNFVIESDDAGNVAGINVEGEFVLSKLAGT